MSNPSNITIGYLNINTIANKFDSLTEQLDKKIDILCFAETKLDNSYLDQQFNLDGFKGPYRKDGKSEHSGGLMVFVNENIPSLELPKTKLCQNIEILPIEINLKKEKWLIIPIYRPQWVSETTFLDCISTFIDHHSKYDNIIILGDFNMTPDDSHIMSFINDHNLYNLIKEPTCFKSPQGKCIDLILTSQKYKHKFSQTFETGFSDFHKMVYTMLKTTFTKLPPKIKFYRSKKNFNTTQFNEELFEKLHNSTTGIYEVFQNSFEQVLNKHLPLKKKVLRGNHKPWVTKELRKQISIRSRLRNIANQTGDQSDITRFKNQRNFVNMIRKSAQKNYFKTLNPKKLNMNKKFFNTFKPFFSSKYSPDERILLVENGNIVTDELAISEVFNEYFTNITDSLNIKQWPESIEVSQIDDQVQRAILKYDNHPSIEKIKSHFPYDHHSTFEFTPISPDIVKDQIKKLDSSKSSSGPIPIDIIKENSETIELFLTDCVNTSMYDCLFPNSLKFADVVPAFKSKDRTSKNNYRPISILPPISKIYERIFADQMNAFIDVKLSPLLCGFRKGFSTKDALLKLLESWRSKLENGQYVGTILCDLSKAFDTLPHDLIIAKLHAYGFGPNSLKLIYDYLSNRKQRCKVGSKISSWRTVKRGVPQGSVLGPLIFNIFINDFILFIKDCELCNFADDQTIYAYDSNMDTVIISLEQDLKRCINWLDINGLVVNPDKFQIMFLGTRNKPKFCLTINGKTVINTDTIKLLGITIDWKLNFNKHVIEIANKANTKARGLCRLRTKLSIDQKLLLYNSFVSSHFGYCPLIWMFCGKTANFMVEKVQKRALRAVYNNFNLSYQEALDKGNHHSIHRRNLNTLICEVYKCTHDLVPPLLQNIFIRKQTNYNLRISNLLNVPNYKTYGLRSFTYKGSLTWNNTPDYLKNSQNLTKFKSTISNLESIYCSCQICS